MKESSNATGNEAKAACKRDADERNFCEDAN